MADSNPTVGELFKAKAVTDDEVSVAVAAYLANPEAGAYPITDGYVLDLKAAVREQDWVWKIARDPAASGRLKHGSIRTAILLARAEKA